MNKCESIVEVLESKMAQNINIIDFNNESILADYFIICETSNQRQMDALKTEFEMLHKQGKFNVRAIEGNSDSGWIVIDVDDIFVHIFNPRTREEFALDKLWVDYDQEQVN